MYRLLWLLLQTFATGGGPSAPPVWEKVFDGSPDKWVSAVVATKRDTWIAGGGWGVATTTVGGTRVESTHGHGVLGLSLDSPTNVYAFGEGELIWHYDGKEWTEEHAGPLPARGRRRSFSEHMLYLSYYEDAAPRSPLVALGLSLVLIKQPDGIWAPPSKADRATLLGLGQSGPKLPTGPARCDGRGWRWLGRSRGFFFCDDRRAFVFDNGTVTSKGKTPHPCGSTPAALAYVAGEIYAACEATIWKTRGETWHQIVAPKEKGLREISSLAFADGCLFVAGAQSVWRRCGDDVD